MTIAFRCLVFIFILLLDACKNDAMDFPEAVCIEHVTIIDPIDGLQKNQTVIIKDGKIEKIAPSDQLPLSSSNQIINAQGKFLIPGLWDTHVHFAYIEELAPSMFDLFLAYGITSVRDTGGKIDWVKKWQREAQKDPTAAPRSHDSRPIARWNT